MRRRTPGPKPSPQTSFEQAGAFRLRWFPARRRSRRAGQHRNRDHGLPRRLKIAPKRSEVRSANGGALRPSRGYRTWRIRSGCCLVTIERRRCTPKWIALILLVRRRCRAKSDRRAAAVLHATREYAETPAGPSKRWTDSSASRRLRESASAPSCMSAWMALLVSVRRFWQCSKCPAHVVGNQAFDAERHGDSLALSRIQCKTEIEGAGAFAPRPAAANSSTGCRPRTRLGPGMR